MLSYCIKCGENTKSIILQVLRAINDGIITLSKCVVLYPAIKNQNLLKNKKQMGY